MAYHDVDNGGGGAVDPVYLKVGQTPLLEIFPLSYIVTHSNALLGSPSEYGTEWLDNKVIQPSKIQFTGIVKYPQRHVFQTIRANMKKHNLKTILCTFFTKAGRAEKMLIERLEEVGDNHRYDGIEIKVSLHEFLEHGEFSN